MARPKTKTELLEAASSNFDALLTLIDSLSDEVLATDFDFSGDDKKTEAHWQRDVNLRDVLTHLHEWHELFVNWVDGNLGGTQTSFLPAPYTWKTYGKLNLEFWERHQGTSLEEAIAMLRASHAASLKAIRRFSETELFEKKHYRWTGSTSVGSYAVSATSSHYAWALKKLKAHLRSIS